MARKQVLGTLGVLVLLAQAVASDSAPNPGNAFDKVVGGYGEYDPHFLTLAGKYPDSMPFARYKHYVRVESLRWFVNAESDVWNDKMVTGTVDMNVGNDTFNVVLGTFPLSRGNKIAPVFNQVVLDNRLFAGGDVRFITFIRGTQTDTPLSGLLKGVASSTLGVANGLVGAASATGATSLLTGAARSLLTGVQGFLTAGPKPREVFSTNGGVSVTIPREKLAGSGYYLLAYRGKRINSRDSEKYDPMSGANKLEVVTDGAIFDVKVDSVPLRGGAWVLYRLTRQPIYGSARSWDTEQRDALAGLDELFQNWELGAVSQDAVKQSLKPTFGDKPNVADRVVAVRTLIQADAVLCDPEKTDEKAYIVAYLRAAQRLAEQMNGYEKWKDEKKKIEEAFGRGGPPSGPPSDPPSDAVIADTIRAEARATADARMEKFNALMAAVKKTSPLTANIFALRDLDARYQDLTGAAPPLARTRAQEEKMLRARLSADGLDDYAPPGAPSDEELWQSLREVQAARRALEQKKRTMLAR